MKKDQIALQVWTLRDLMENNFVKCFEETAKIGYKGVEIGDTPDMDIGAFKKIFADLDLKCVGCHVALDLLENDLDRVIDRHLELGTEYIVVPWLDESRRKDKSAYIQTRNLIVSIAEKLSVHGFGVCYHNHAFEFEKIDGKYGYDILCESFSPKLGAELDVYWVAYGKEDPVKYIDMLAGRVPLIHMKDMEANENRDFCEVGYGMLDMPQIIKAGDMAGAKWYIVEQDVCKRDPVESVRMSYNYLTSLSE